MRPTPPSHTLGHKVQGFLKIRCIRIIVQAMTKRLHFNKQVSERDHLTSL